MPEFFPLRAVMALRKTAAGFARTVTSLKNAGNPFYCLPVGVSLYFCSLEAKIYG